MGLVRKESLEEQYAKILEDLSLSIDIEIPNEDKNNEKIEDKEKK